MHKDSLMPSFQQKYFCLKFTRVLQKSANWRPCFGRSVALEAAATFKLREGKPFKGSKDTGLVCPYVQKAAK